MIWGWVGFSSHIWYAAYIMIETQQNIFWEFLHNSYMLSECPDKMILIKNITKFAEKQNIRKNQYILEQEVEFQKYSWVYNYQKWTLEVKQTAPDTKTTSKRQLLQTGIHHIKMQLSNVKKQSSEQTK